MRQRQLSLSATTLFRICTISGTLRGKLEDGAHERGGVVAGSIDGRGGR